MSYKAKLEFTNRPINEKHSLIYVLLKVLNERAVRCQTLHNITHIYINKTGPERGSITKHQDRCIPLLLPHIHARPSLDSSFSEDITDHPSTFALNKVHDVIQSKKKVDGPHGPFSSVSDKYDHTVLFPVYDRLVISIGHRGKILYSLTVNTYIKRNLNLPSFEVGSFTIKQAHCSAYEWYTLNKKCFTVFNYA